MPSETMPVALAADERGDVRELRGWRAAGRAGVEISSLPVKELIRLPKGGYLYRLPGRRPVGFSHRGESPRVLEGAAVAAFVPPGYLVTRLAAFASEPGAPSLPLNTYAAVCWWRGGFWVAARRLDMDRRHDTSTIDERRLQQGIESWRKRFPGNRLIAHHAEHCVFQYRCPNACNLFLRRWEAPAAVSPACNSECLGCISRRRPDGGAGAQERIDFVPSAAEIIELGSEHLRRAPRAMLSFGQGCEGEPLLQAPLLEEAIRAIRRRTGRGQLHLNTNGSPLAGLESLLPAGLDSVRFTLPAAGEELCRAYRCGAGPTPAEISQAAALAHRAGLLVSLNLLVFPGLTDDPAELQALETMLAAGAVDMLQWRNLNIDPELYWAHLRKEGWHPHGSPIGLLSMLARLRRRFPRLRHGCFNPLKPRKKDQ